MIQNMKNTKQTDNRHLYDRQYFKESKYFQLDVGRTNLFTAIIEPYKPKKILDVGCGLGKFVKDLNLKGYQAYGIDFAPTLEKNYWGGDKHLKVADARKIPFVDNKFDIVFSSDFFEHLDEEDVDLVVSEMKRVCKPNGTIIAEVGIAGSRHLDGKQAKYHLTHKPRSWWEKKLDGIRLMSFDKVELGSGKRPHPGFLTVDVEADSNPDVVGDFRKFTFHRIQIIRAHHLLEHFSRDEAIDVLKSWYRWLDVNGTLIVETPDFEGICENFNKDRYWMTRHAYGSQEADWAFHRDGWYEEKFRKILYPIGFTIDNITKGVSRKILPNITVTARKTG